MKWLERRTVTRKKWQTFGSTITYAGHRLLFVGVWSPKLLDDRAWSSRVASDRRALRARFATICPTYPLLVMFRRAREYLHSRPVRVIGESAVL